MKNNTLLSILFAAISASFAIDGLHGAAGASLVAGLVLILVADYAGPSRLAPVEAGSVRASQGASRPATPAGPSARTAVTGPRNRGWAENGALQRRLVDGPVY